MGMGWLRKNPEGIPRADGEMGGRSPSENDSSSIECVVTLVRRELEDFLDFIVFGVHAGINCLRTKANRVKGRRQHARADGADRGSSR